MGLQLRVRQASGTRIVDLEERDRLRPVLVGRDELADIRVDTAAVSRTHCILYVIDAQWVVRDASSAAGTLVNGQRIDQPVPLNVGDVIGLGDWEGAPAIEVATSGSSSLAAPAALQADQGGVADAWMGGDAAHELPAEIPAWKGATARRRGPSQDWVPWAVGLSALMVLAGGWMIYRLVSAHTPPPPVAIKPPVAEATPQMAIQRDSIFDFPRQNGTDPTTRPGISGPGRAATVPPDGVGRAPARPLFGEDKVITTAPVTEAPPDPRKLEDAWKIVEEARAADPPPKALIVYQQYRRDRPGILEIDLNAYEQDALDQIWWQRIHKLCDRRDELGKAIQKLDRDIAEEPVAAAKQKMRDEKAAMVEQHQLIVGVLTEEMGFTGKQVPNEFDDIQLAELRKARDQAKYDKWSKKVIKSVVTTYSLPWERTR